MYNSSGARGGPNARSSGGFVQRHHMVRNGLIMAGASLAGGAASRKFPGLRPKISVADLKKIKLPKNGIIWN